MCRIFFGTLFPRIVDDAYRNKNEAEVYPHDRAGRANPFCLRHPLFTAAKMLQRGWVQRIFQDEDFSPQEMRDGLIRLIATVNPETPDTASPFQGFFSDVVNCRR